MEQLLCLFPVFLAIARKAKVEKRGGVAGLQLDDFLKILLRFPRFIPPQRNQAAVPDNAEIARIETRRLIDRLAGLRGPAHADQGGSQVEVGLRVAGIEADRLTEVVHSPGVVPRFSGDQAQIPKDIRISRILFLRTFKQFPRRGAVFRAHGDGGQIDKRGRVSGIQRQGRFKGLAGFVIVTLIQPRQADVPADAAVPGCQSRRPVEGVPCLVGQAEPQQGRSLVQVRGHM